MYTGSISSKIRVNASNILGWRTKRKIVVLESDDWGSIRTSNKAGFNGMLKAGLDVDKSIYTINDCLESNDDLELLFDLFLEFKDVTGRPPVLTPMCIVANPDFEKIRESGFETYHFEELKATLEYYPNHNHVLDLWREGIKERLFVPGLHGREHLNVIRWMQAIKFPDAPLRSAFDHQSIGVASRQGKSINEYLGAFHPESIEEVHSFEKIVKDAGELFNKYCGYYPDCFIAPNREEPKEMETYLKEVGVKYMTRSKKRKYPIGDGTFKMELNWLGKRATSGQLSLVRNCFYEPANLLEYPANTDWAGNCLKEMEIAFRWGKPAIISTHRVNFVGSIQTKYRDVSFKYLRNLLKTMLDRWPDIEFLTSKELGELINNDSSN